jgi:hypothetical protein
VQGRGVSLRIVQGRGVSLRIVQGRGVSLQGTHKSSSTAESLGTTREVGREWLLVMGVGCDALDQGRGQWVKSRTWVMD